MSSAAEIDWRAFYEEADRDTGKHELSRAFLTAYALNHQQSPHHTLIEECKSFSMLHQESLLLLNYLARRVRGAVLEIGPYIGGSTVAIGTGLKLGRGGPHIVVEVGGTYPEHPSYPSHDILRDLKDNIRKYDLRNLHLLEGWSYDPEVQTRLAEALGSKLIDLLFIDSDGAAGRDFAMYRNFLADGCIIVLDDFLVPSSDAASKQVGVRSWVADAADNKIVEDLGVYLWGTWVGRYRKQR
jgi:predicted O-methyltransferase YrrM